MNNKFCSSGVINMEQSFVKCNKTKSPSQAVHSTRVYPDLFSMKQVGVFLPRSNSFFMECWSLSPVNNLSNFPHSLLKPISTSTCEEALLMHPKCLCLNLLTECKWQRWNYFVQGQDQLKTHCAVEKTLLLFLLTIKGVIPKLCRYVCSCRGSILPLRF